MAADPTDEHTIGFGGQYMFYFSDDTNDTAWNERVNGTVELAATSLEYDYPDIVFFSPEILFRYQIDDDSLVSRICGTEHYAAGVQRDWKDTEWFAAVNDGISTSDLFKSTDDGDSWELIEEFNYLITCIMPDSASNRLYAAGGDDVHISSDNGTNWGNPEPITNGEIQAIDIRPADNEALLLADNGGGVWRSTDSGDEWNQINSGLTNTNATCIKYCPGQSKIALVGTAAGVYRSTNVDDTTPSWAYRMTGVWEDTITTIDFHPTDNSVVYMATKDDGIGSMYVSADTGKCWIGFEPGLDGEIIYDIASDADSNQDSIFIATDEGIYYMYNPVHCGTITSNETWGPGIVIVNGDVTVDSGDTLTIEDSTTVLFTYDFDKEVDGSDTSLPELIIEGTLIAEGTSSDSIIFTSSKEVIGSPGEGDWYGIHFKAGSEGVFEYCAIRYAETGIEMEDTSEVNINHSLIAKSESKGIDNYKGYLYIDSSIVDDNGAYGIYLNRAKAEIDSCVISYHTSYGIYCYADYTGMDTTKILNTLIDNNSGPGEIMTSQYGIYSSKDSIKIDLCNIDGFKQGGIKTYGSDGLFTRNTFKDGNYGIYVDRGGAPDIQYCFFDSTLDTGVRATDGSHPDLGDSSQTDGNNSFIACDDYFIYFDKKGDTNADTLMAQMNWFGSSTPDTTKFYTDYSTRVINWRPCRTSSPKLYIDGVLPSEMILSQNYPNPFNPTTVIEFYLSESRHTKVTIYNILGQEITTPVDRYLESGLNSFVWDGKNARGESVSSGIYFYTIQSGDNFASKKMLLLR